MNAALQSELSIPDYFRSPCWRWNLAHMCYLNDAIDIRELMRAARAGDDPWLLEACQFYRHARGSNVCNPMNQVRYPEMYEAFMLMMANNQFADYRFALQAMCCTTATDEEIAAAVEPNNGARVIELFRKVFFDIDAYKHNKIKMVCSVLAQAERNVHDPTQDSDFTWKIMAYHNGFDAFQAFMGFRAGGFLPENLISYMTTISTLRRIYASFHLTLSMRTMFAAERIALLDHIDKHEAMKKAMPGHSDLDKVNEVSANAFIEMVQNHADQFVAGKRDATPHTFEAGVSPKYLPDATLARRLLPNVHSV